MKQNNNFWIKPFALMLTLLSAHALKAQSVDTVCYGAVPIQFVSLSAANGSLGETDYAYEWQDSTASGTWSPAPGLNSDTLYQASGLTETTWYRRKVSVAFCGEEAFSNVIEVTVLDSISPNMSNLIDANCANTTDGSASVAPTGGLGNFQYAWDNGETTATAVGLDTGLHFVTITDGFGCSNIAAVTVGFTNLPPAFSFGIDTVSLDSDWIPTITGPSGYNSYVWSTGGTDSLLNINSAGTYSLTVTDSNGCATTDSIYVILTVGVAENEMNFEAKVFPNPTRNEVNVLVGNNFAPDEVEIRTFDGKLVIQQQRTSAINISTLSGGVYLIDVTHDGQTVRKKLVVN